MLVTGGTHGIGAAVASRFADHGDSVVVMSRRLPADAGVEADSRIVYRAGDVAVFDETADVVAATVHDFGGIDVLVNSAGISGARSGLDAFDPADAAHVLAVNVMGTMQMIAAATPALSSGSGGVVVNIGSICGVVANHESIAYHASKGAITALTRSAALQLAPRGVRVVEVSPAWVLTEITQATLRAHPEAAALGRSLHMTGAMLTPEDVAAAVLLLCEPGARAITGSTVAVDNGYLGFRGPNFVAAADEAAS